MNKRPRITGTLSLITPIVASIVLAGCGPTYRELRLEGQQAMLRGDYYPARYILLQADELTRNQAYNLHDIGFCSVMVARDRMDQMNYAAAMRELDLAIDYYDRALSAHPGHQAVIEGKNVALELKGLPNAALSHAQWAVRVVGPSARQHTFLARELEERGDIEGALLRYRQAVAMEHRNAGAHVAIARFLLRHENERAASRRVRVEFQLRGREWQSPQGETKYFNSLDVWSIDHLGSSAGSSAGSSQEEPPLPDGPPPGFDDVPF